MRLEIKLPKRIVARDYHELQNFAFQCIDLEIPIKVKEVGFVDGEYIGIVYTGSLKEPENELMVKKIRKECKEE